jgi:hypothetical protein
MHPEDEEPGDPADGIFRGLSCGAAGMVHALDRLAEAGFYEPSLDLAAIAGSLYEAALASPDEEGAGASLMIGSSGILLVAHRLAPSMTTADTLADVIAANVTHPANELLRGQARARRSRDARAPGRNASRNCGGRALANCSPARRRTACGRRTSSAGINA